jgi:hypothetical protein
MLPSYSKNPPPLGTRRNNNCGYLSLADTFPRFTVGHTPKGAGPSQRRELLRDDGAGWNQLLPLW